MFVEEVTGGGNYIPLTKSLPSIRLEKRIYSSLLVAAGSFALFRCVSLEGEWHGTANIRSDLRNGDQQLNQRKNCDDDGGGVRRSRREEGGITC